MGYLVFEHGDSGFFTYIKAIEVMQLLVVVLVPISELAPGSALAYSKFTNEFKGTIKKVPSRIGMAIIYTPVALVAAWFFADCVLHSEFASSGAIGSLKVLLVSAALFVHFMKRDLETLFLHNYSGETGLSSACIISLSYTTMAVHLNLVQQKSQQLVPPAVDLTWVGVGVFLIGILGNFYHHFLLRGLRKTGDRKYVIPEGGLFGVFVAPHYIFEIVSFVGLTLISQTYMSFATLLFVISYLGCRSYSTKQWYLKKIDGFPKRRCVLIPFVF